MNFIKVEDGVPVGNAVVGSNLRALIPNVSLPIPVTPPDVKDFGYEPYLFTEKPEHGHYEKAVIVTPIQNANGLWIQQWAVEPMSDAEKAAADQFESKRMRDARTGLLARTDWTQLADSPTEGDSWTTYRQALRDLPTQAGFPWDVEWPEPPEVPGY